MACGPVWNTCLRAIELWFDDCLNAATIANDGIKIMAERSVNTIAPALWDCIGQKVLTNLYVTLLYIDYIRAIKTWMHD